MDSPKETPPTLSWSQRNLVLPLLRVFVGAVMIPFGPLRVRGKYRVPRRGGVLILANHLSDADPVIVYAACPRPVYFMAKSELFSMRFVGRALKMAKAFPVKRGEPDRNAIKRAVALIQAGEAVCVFPEGEISQEGTLLPLKAGVALIARMIDAPVICLGLRGTERIVPYGSMVPRPALQRVEAEWGETKTFDRHASAEEFLEWAEGQLRMLTGQSREL
jgi:1-acyl-sn-glycerol-3-phosphate acyltransferase